jgi:16S rRNA C1402 N4-methylase RsmH
MDIVHEPVMVQEYLKYLPSHPRVVVDGTFGHGGHVRALLEE